MNQLEFFYSSNKQIIEHALFHIRNKSYTKKNITKKSGGIRELSIPPVKAKIVQKKFNTILQNIYNPSASIHSFIKLLDNDKRTIVSNASMHINKHTVINVDIENFFDSMNFGRVRGLFLSKPFLTNEKIATKLAQLVIFDDRLPQGAPTSPIISNMICQRMDHEFIKFAKNNHLTFTRYADDITFSTNKKNMDEKVILTNIESIINNNGFTLNHKKTRIQKHYNCQIVTGLKVNKKVNVDRKYIRQIRSMLFSWYKENLQKASEKHFLFNKQREKYRLTVEINFLNILLGKINFLGQVKGLNDPLYLKFIHSYYLLQDNFILKNKSEIFETLDLANLERSKLLTTFMPIYDSILVFVEGVTDIDYLKAALKFFQNKDMFKNLKIRFCNLNGWVNVKNMHILLYSNNKDMTPEIRKMQECILPILNDQLKLCFILDADDDSIMGHFNHKKQKNYFLIDEKNKGYIEKLIDQDTIVQLINEHGYIIDVDRKELKGKSKEGLEKYLKSKESKDENIHAVTKTSYIAYKNMILEKTTLSKMITKRNDIDYENFIDVFNFLESFTIDNTYAKIQNCNQ